MSYGQGGYRQPDLRPGMHVQTDTGWAGQIVEVIPAPPGYDGMVRVAWQGYGTTDVTMSSFSVENGVAWIRAQPPAQQQRPTAQSAVQHTMPLDTTPDDDMATQLAGPARQPAQQEPSHVNPYVADPPLVTEEPAPVHTAGRGQDQEHVNPLVTDQPVVTPEPPPVQPLGGRQMDPDATILPRGSRETPVSGYQQPYDDRSDQTMIARPALPTTPDQGNDQTVLAHPPMPDSAETVLSRPVTPVAPEMPPSPVEAPGVLPGHSEPDAVPDAALRGSGAEPAAEVASVMPTEEREVTVPVIEEQVAARAEWRDAGSITVRTVMEEIPQTLSHETERDEIFVERVTIGRVLEDSEEVTQREEGGVTIIPVIVEEAVVVTRRVLAEEVRITKRTIPTVQTVQAVVRKERVEIDAGDLADRVHDDTGADAASIPSQAARGDDTA